MRRWRAGDNSADLAADYGLTTDEVDEALRYEATPLSLLSFAAVQLVMERSPWLIARRSSSTGSLREDRREAELRNAGASVELHDEHSAQTTPDSAWIPDVRALVDG